MTWAGTSRAWIRKRKQGAGDRTRASEIKGLCETWEMSTDTSVYKVSSPTDRGNVFTPVTDPCTVRVAAYTEHAEIGGQCIAFVVMPIEMGIICFCLTFRLLSRGQV